MYQVITADCRELLIGKKGERKARLAGVLQSRFRRIDADGDQLYASALKLIEAILKAP